MEWWFRLGIHKFPENLKKKTCYCMHLQIFKKFSRKISTDFLKKLSCYLRHLQIFKKFSRNFLTDFLKRLSCYLWHLRIFKKFSKRFSAFLWGSNPLIYSGCIGYSGASILDSLRMC